MKRLSVT